MNVEEIKKEKEITDTELIDKIAKAVRAYGEIEAHSFREQFLQGLISYGKLVGKLKELERKGEIELEYDDYGNLWIS